MSHKIAKAHRAFQANKASVKQMHLILLRTRPARVSTPVKTRKRKPATRLFDPKPRLPLIVIKPIRALWRMVSGTTQTPVPSSFAKQYQRWSKSDMDRAAYG